MSSAGESADITRLLRAWGRGDSDALDRLTVEETGEVLQVAPQTVMRDWRLARAWLARELSVSSK